MTLPDVFALDALNDSAFRLHLLAVRMCLDLGLGSLPYGRAKSLGKQRAIDELLSKGVWTDNGTGYEAADFVAAYPQEARLQVRKTDAERSKAYRQRKNRHDRHVTECDAPCDDRHAQSDDRHEPSRDAVTPTVTQVLSPHTPQSPKLSGSSLDSGSDLLCDSGSEDLTGSAREATKPKAEPKRRAPKTAIPADWKPNDGHRAFCRTEGIDCDAEAERFRLNAEGKDVRWTDWDRAFGSWLRTPYPKLMTGYVSGRPPGAVEHQRRGGPVDDPPARRIVAPGPPLPIMRQVDAEAALARLKRNAGAQ